MTTATSFAAAGLSLSIYRPSVSVDESTAPYTVTYTPRGSLLADMLQQYVDTYNHTIKAMGGFGSAAFSLSDSQLDVERWIQDGLAAHVEVRNPAGAIAWAGYVDSMVIRFGAFSLSLGPLSTVANRIRVNYSYIEPGYDVTQQERRFTAIAEDAISQRDYGVIWKIVSQSGMTTTAADAVRDLYLAENRRARGSQRVSSGDSQAASVQFQCQGYGARLTYPYFKRDIQTWNLSYKVDDILSQDPNGLFPNRMITLNTLQVNKWEDDSKTAWALIKSLVALGDASANRYLFGVYEDQQVRYEQAPSELAYHYSLIEESAQVTTPSGQLVAPWDIRPGRWLMVPSILVGKTLPTDLREDPRCMFLEEVRYQAPYSFSLSGGSTDTLPQTLAALGLSGRSA